MCTELELDREGRYGRAWALCTTYADHLIADAEMPSVKQTPFVQRTLECFGPATFAVLERAYFDLDYRSEFSATHQTTFASRTAETDRLHFFEGDSSSASLRLMVSDRADGYLGYIVLRPQSPGAIGRSIIPPRKALEELADGETLAEHVRTAVAEPVELFGVPLTAVGVPFMEQDGRLLRCVHAAAWMCHYTAVLRGIVPRKSTADVYAAEDDQYTLGRRFPSSGMTDDQLNRVLGRIGLPADFLDHPELSKVRNPRWFDRPKAWNAKDEDGAWLVENLTASICRYLNSGLPVILALNEQNHAQVICGYLRNDDLAKPIDATDPSCVEYFIVNDDQHSPFRLVKIADLIKLFDRSWDALSVLAPLPTGLWLSGSEAQSAGATVFADQISARISNFDQWALHWAVDDGSDRLAALEAVKALMDGAATATVGEPTGLAIRTSAMSGSDFKQSYRRLTADPTLHELVGYVNLPKYVWVVEVLDRGLRASHDPKQPAVVGTIVLDGSNVVKRPEEISAVGALFAHLPGQASVETWRDPDGWIPVALGERFSSRWEHDRDRLVDFRGISARAKGAVAAP